MSPAPEASASPVGKLVASSAKKVASKSVKASAKAVAEAPVSSAPQTPDKPTASTGEVAAKPAKTPRGKGKSGSAKSGTGPKINPAIANGTATLIYARPMKPADLAKAAKAQAAAKAAKQSAAASAAEANHLQRPGGIVPAPVPADAKPRKNQAGFNAKQLDVFRQLLLEKRAELLGDMRSMEHEALRSTSGSNLSNLPVHMADMGTDNYEQEFTLGLVEKDRLLLREINAALQKIQDGSYGICEGTGKPINTARLEVRPWTRYSIEYARKIEQGLVRPARREISG